MNLPDTNHAYLKIQAEIVLAEEFDIHKLTFNTIAGTLCGVNMNFCKEPFSKTFLINVAYNHKRCMPLILFLQYDYLTLRELF